MIETRLFAMAMAGSVSLAACKFDRPPDVTDVDATTGYLVGGSVTGLWTGADPGLELQLTPTGRAPLTLPVDNEGAFTFGERLDSGTAFTLSVLTDADQHDCAVAPGSVSRTVASADITDLVVACTSFVPVSVALSTPITFTFDPQQADQPLALSALQQEVRITVDGPVGTSAWLDGAALALQTASPPVALVDGVNTVLVDFAVGTLSRRYRLLVDRGGAAAEEYRYQKSSNIGMGDRYGTAVAASGDLVAIGALFEDSDGTGLNENAPNSGAVYVLRRTGQTYVQERMLKGTMVTDGRTFGNAVALDGDVLVVGAYEDSGAAFQAGAAYVFRRTAPGTWTEEARLTASNPTMYGRFGIDVAVHGDLVAIGADREDGAPVNAGAVYLYRKVGSAWTEETILRAPDAVAADFFGTGVALAQDLVAIGAPYEGSSTTGVQTTPATDTGAPQSGAVYVFRRESTAWLLEAYIKPSTVRNAAHFGYYLDLDGSTLAVGRTTDVHVYSRSGTTWTRDARLEPMAPALSNIPRLSVRRDMLAAGDTSPSQNAGRVLLWQRVGASWQPLPALSASNADLNDDFGSAVALAPDGLVVGAAQESSGGLPGNNGASDAGAVYVFR